jgi:hypothetical protein
MMAELALFAAWGALSTPAFPRMGDGKAEIRFLVATRDLAV